MTRSRTTITLPAGGVDVEDWERGRTDADEMPNVYRGFTGTLRTVDCPERDRDIRIELYGVQRMDGSVRREVNVSEIDHPLTLATARQLGAALIAAADEAEQMNGYDMLGVQTD
jgi:hypothetical protein